MVKQEVKYAVYNRNAPITIVGSEERAEQISVAFGNLSKYEPVGLIESEKINLQIERDIIEENSAIRKILTRS